MTRLSAASAGFIVLRRERAEHHEFASEGWTPDGCGIWSTWEAAAVHRDTLTAVAPQREWAVAHVILDDHRDLPC